MLARRKPDNRATGAGPLSVVAAPNAATGSLPVAKNPLVPPIPDEAIGIRDQNIKPVLEEAFVVETPLYRITGGGAIISQHYGQFTRETLVYTDVHGFEEQLNPITATKIPMSVYDREETIEELPNLNESVQPVVFDLNINEKEFDEEKVEE